MIRLTRRPAAMLHLVESWRNILAGLALTLLVVSVVSVCVTGQPEAGGRFSAEPAAATGHADHVKPGTAPGNGPALDTAGPAPHGEGHRHNCCGEYATPATYAAAQRPEGQAVLALPEPALTDPPAAAPSPIAMVPGPLPPSPSLIEMSISRT
ncbi:hypothetical protein [Crystallibacter degradans]|uniref:hypothetical protein n=1 Tax=Crystallibacter degradans TaxID=2726743 RepID=UPI0014765FA8|nr:hypothetical protein [Arthrobacter sp. SF27]NMR32201.1 hypothetical protein [Arthrobacter sp. SF27]